MKLSKKLKQLTNVKKGFLKPYDYSIDVNGETVFIKTVSFHGDAIITFYSINHLSIKTGKVKNNRFIMKDEIIHKLHDFEKLENKVLLFDKEPFKMLHQVNESDIVEITKPSIYNYRLIYKEEELIALVK